MITDTIYLLMGGIICYQLFMNARYEGFSRLGAMMIAIPASFIWPMVLLIFIVEKFLDSED